MAKLSINETTTFRWSFEEDVTHYAAAGVPGIGVWRRKISDYGEIKAAELLAESRVAASHLFWAGGFTGSDGRPYRASIEDAAEAIRTAHAIRAESVVVYSGARAGHTHNHARRLFKDALRELAPLAAEMQVRLAVEPMHPGCGAEFTFLHSLDDALLLLSQAGDANLKLVFDTYQLAWDRRVLARIPQIVGQVALVQLGDARCPPNGEQNRCPLGEGSLPLREVVHAFLDAGYDGYFDVELLGEEIERIDYPTLVQRSKQAFEQLCG